MNELAHFAAQRQFRTMSKENCTTCTHARKSGRCMLFNRHAFWPQEADKKDIIQLTCNHHSTGGA